MSVNKVLNEVDLLFEKINSLPEDIRQAAINKIQENISPKSEIVPITKTTSAESKFYVRKKGPVPKLRPLKKVSKLQKQKDSAAIIPAAAVDDTSKVIEETRHPLPSQTTKVKIKNKTRTDPLSNSNKDFVLDSKKLTRKRNTKTKVSKECKTSSELLKKQKQVTIIHVDLLASSSINEQQKSQENNKETKKQDCVCPFCDITFKKPSNLKIHMKRHKNQRDFNCVKCRYRSVAKGDMERHMISVHNKVKDMICEYCAKAFALKKSLLQHIRTMHTPRKTKFCCALCSFETNQKNNLKVHFRVRHLGDYDTHVCPVCDAKVRLKSAFLEHVRTHTGDRPFQCDLCPANFACVGRLNTHKRTIHAPRQFSCNTCDKKFPTRYSVERHMNVHTNGKPHACPFCQFSCNMQGNLTKHVRNVHRKPDFSLREYKKQLQKTESDKISKPPKQWTTKGQKAVKNYLSDYSKALGRKVTVTQLIAQEKSRKQEEKEAKEKAKIELINRITSKEHSYVLKPVPLPALLTPEPALNNIYLEAMAAANLDFTSNALSESMLDHLGEDSSFILPEDDILLSYSDVLQVPGLEHLTGEQGMEHLNAVQGLDPLSVESTLLQVPNCFVQLPSGEKVECSVNMLRDFNQLGDATTCGMVNTPLLNDGLGLLPAGMDFQSSVLIIVGEPVTNQSV